MSARTLVVLRQRLLREERDFSHRLRTELALREHQPAPLTKPESIRRGEVEDVLDWKAAKLHSLRVELRQAEQAEREQARAAARHVAP